MVILPVPYDSTASGWVGSREGPRANAQLAAKLMYRLIGLAARE